MLLAAIYGVRQDHRAGRAQGQRAHYAAETRLAVDMAGDPLAGEVLVHDHLVGASRGDALLLEAFRKFSGPVRQWPEGHGPIHGAPLVVVPEAVVLNPPPEVIGPRLRIDGGHQGVVPSGRHIILKIMQAGDLGWEQAGRRWSFCRNQSQIPFYSTGLDDVLRRLYTLEGTL